MPTPKYYTKNEILKYMASQGLVYKRLKKHFEEWFQHYANDWYIDVDKYEKNEW